MSLFISTSRKTMNFILMSAVHDYFYKKYTYALANGIARNNLKRMHVFLLINNEIGMK